MEDINREIVNGANPSIIWSQYMDFLATYGKQMKATYTKRMRENNPFTWAELDVMNKDIHDKLDKLMTWSDNLEVESKKLLKQRITESKLKKIIAESMRKVLNETELDYDEDNFSGRYYYPAHYDIYIGDSIEYHGVSEEEVDKLYIAAERKAEMWGEKVSIQEV